jgi:hypothetical protein
MYNDTITLFNRNPGGRGQPDCWYPTVIKNVNLIVDRAAVVAKYGAESKDNAILNIRYAVKDGKIMVAGKPWMPPKSWDKTEKTITFTGGNDFDFFWVGEWTEGVKQDADYGAEGFYGFMNRTHDFVFAINSVSKLSVIPHFEITGK